MAAQAGPNSDLGGGGLAKVVSGYRHGATVAFPTLAPAAARPAEQREPATDWRANVLVRESADKGDVCSDYERRWDGQRCIRQMVSLQLTHCSDHPSRDLLPAPETLGAYSDS